MQRPLGLRLLIFVLVFLGIGGLYGGITMLADPTGGLLRMGDILALLPVRSFVLPGLFLVAFMGLLPFVLAYALLRRPRWRLPAAWLRWGLSYWALTASLLLGGVLAMWMIVQIALIGLHWPIQYVTSADALLLMLLARSPGVRDAMRR